MNSLFWCGFSQHITQWSRIRSVDNLLWLFECFWEWKQSGWMSQKWTCSKHFTPVFTVVHLWTETPTQSQVFPSVNTASVDIFALVVAASLCIWYSRTLLTLSAQLCCFCCLKSLKPLHTIVDFSDTYRCNGH